MWSGAVQYLTSVIFCRAYTEGEHTKSITNTIQKKIKAFLADTDNLPIKKYLRSDIDEKLRVKYEIQDSDLNEPYGRKTVCWINNINGCPVDDDINYSPTMFNDEMMLASKLVRKSARVNKIVRRTSSRDK